VARHSGDRDNTVFPLAIPSARGTKKTSNIVLMLSIVALSLYIHRTLKLTHNTTAATCRCPPPPTLRPTPPYAASRRARCRRKTAARGGSPDAEERPLVDTRRRSTTRLVGSAPNAAPCRRASTTILDDAPRRRRSQRCACNKKIYITISQTRNKTQKGEETWLQWSGGRCQREGRW
jgi:hypothetical protein